MSQEPLHVRDQGPATEWHFEGFSESELEQSIPERFEQMVARYPDRPAAHGERHKFTYRRLNATANRIARALLDRLGQGEEPVCILLDNDAQAVAAMLGILKAGRPYAPVDPAVPRERLAYFVSDSAAQLIVTSTPHEPLARLLSPPGREPLNIDTLDPSLSDADLKLAISPDSLAYIYYTSGSSGEPKGVYNSHRNLLHRVLRNATFFRLTPADRLSCVRSLSFSGSMKDVWCSVLTGASVHLFDLRNRGFAQMAEWLAEEEITIYVSVTTSYRQLAAALGSAPAPRALRVIHIGGEPIRWSDLELHEEHFPPTCRLAVGLGITESGNVTRQYVDRQTRLESEDVPAGYPLPGMEVLILDDAGQELPPSQVGQIAVRSKYLTLGYWRKPELTRARFRPDPAGTSARVYLTGDMGYLRPDGCLVCLGRADDQVKVAGHRVELGEVEQALLAHDKVSEVAIVAQPSPSGDSLLVAYFVPAGQDVPSVSELRSFLAVRLSAPIIPSRFVPLDEMPLTRSGKVDRRALPAPDTRRPRLATAYAAPRNTLEQQVAGIWQEILGLDRVGIHDNFFDLGGHSLLATRIIAQMRDALRADISYQMLFAVPTVAGIAAAVEEQQAREVDLEQLEQMVADLEGMSDETAARMLLDGGGTG
jgi:amino acid adenylation domain-containing protein